MKTLRSKDSTTLGDKPDGDDSGGGSGSSLSEGSKEGLATIVGSSLCQFGMLY